MSDTAQIIRGVLIQVADARLLLPNATIAEVLSYADPDRVENAPDWLLGRIRWRGQVPVHLVHRRNTRATVMVITPARITAIAPRSWPLKRSPASQAPRATAITGLT